MMRTSGSIAGSVVPMSSYNLAKEYVCYYSGLLLLTNQYQKWETFLELGPMSWEKIIDASWRRRVGLRFMFMLLRCDPEAYTVS